jgi:DNA-binding MurR/RpiR family transcriptional regulator
MHNEDAPKVIDTIISCYQSLPDAEKTVADFILKRVDTVSTLSATQIARQSGTSNTTVSRFVRSIGYPSFSEMRYALAREESSKNDPAFDVSAGISLSNVSGSMRYIMQTKIDEFESTLASLGEAEVRQAVELLANARTVILVGVGSSMPIAQSAAIKFSQAGVNAFSPSTTDAAQLSASLMSPDDVLVVISNSGQSDRLRRVMDSAIDQGVTSIVITHNPSSELASRASLVLPVVSRDYLLVSSFDFSHNSINFVLEVLLLLLFHSSRETNEYKLELFNRSMAREKGSGASDEGSTDDEKPQFGFCQS